MRVSNMNRIFSGEKVTIKVALVASFLLLAIGLSACRRELPVADEQYESPTSYSVETHDGFTVTDAQRDREFPVRVRYPSEYEGPIPVVIFSHGAGAVDRGHLLYQEWGTRLARSGYVVIHIAHVRSGSESHCEPLGILSGECRTLTLLSGDTLSSTWFDRPRDVSAVIDSLDEIGSSAGIELDSERIALMGHSGGAHTVMSSVGALVDFSDTVTGVSYFEPRIRAFVAHSPQGPGSLGFNDSSWDGITVPMLITTGAADTGPTVSDAAMRRVPFQRMDGSDQYELYIDSPDAEHSVFGLSDKVGQGDRPLTQLETYVLSTSLAFLDGYLLNEGSALEWLESDAISEWSNGEARIEAK